MKKFINDNLSLLVITLGLILLFLPIIILGQSSYLIIDDGLNIDFLIYNLLREQGLFFDFNSFSKIESLFSGGIELRFIANKFKFMSLLFFLFDPFYAYVINSILVRLIGFFGFIYLIQEIAPNISKLIAVLTSLAFALLPIYTQGGLTILGLPILFLAFYNLCNNRCLLISYILIFTYVFYSSFILFPFITIIISFWLFILAINRVNIIPTIIGVGLFILISVLLEYQILFNVNFEESHRDLRNLYDTAEPSFLGLLYGIFKKTFIGFFHPSWFVSIPIFLLVFLKLKRSQKYTIALIIAIVLFNLIDSIRPILENQINFIKIFDIGRINWFNPFLIFLMFTAFIIESKIEKTNPKLLLAIIMLQVSINFLRNPEFSFNIIDNKIAAKLFFDDDMLVKNLSAFNSTPYNINKISSLDFDDFFSEDLFSEVNKFINKPQNSYKVIGYGLDPSVLLYNGFYTLDGYYPNHDKDYHIEFDKIQNDNDLRASNRLIINYESCINCSRDLGDFEIKNLNLNFLQLKKMGADFLISAIQINDLSPELVFEKKFQNENYIIYLYKIV